MESQALASLDIPEDIINTLKELPPDRREQVFDLVRSLAQQDRTDRFITLGMFAGDNQSTEEDFKLAEFHGDLDDSLDWS